MGKKQYVSPTDKKLALAAAFFPKNYPPKEQGEELPRYSKSLNNLHTVSSSRKSVPQSMCAINEEVAQQQQGDSWKIPLCGLRASKTDGSDDEDDDSAAVAGKKAVALKKSMSLQEPDHSVRSPPIAVPLRRRETSGRKRKCEMVVGKGGGNMRNSGGYFFDKYMKRFRERCSLSLHRCQSVDVVEFDNHRHDGDDFIIDDDFDDDDDDFDDDEYVVAAKNNREDEAGIDVDHRSIDRPRHLPLVAANDDLYPLRFGSSRCWGAAGIDLPRFWGDAVSGGAIDDDAGGDLVFYGTANLSRGSSVMGALASKCAGGGGGGSNGGACRYSDSNSETLKAMETLYLCNFKVSTTGDWLCLKEVLDDSSAAICADQSLLSHLTASVTVECNSAAFALSFVLIWFIRLIFSSIAGAT
ncbi:MAG: hypothetical protein AAFP26_13620, partial [Planctomycetota bacterium]